MLIYSWKSSDVGTIINNKCIPQEEHLLTHPTQFHQSCCQQLSSHPHHSGLVNDKV